MRPGGRTKKKGEIDLQVPASDYVRAADRMTEEAPVFQLDCWSR